MRAQEITELACLLKPAEDCCLVLVLVLVLVLLAYFPVGASTEDQHHEFWGQERMDGQQVKGSSFLWAHDGEQNMPDSIHTQNPIQLASAVRGTGERACDFEFEMRRGAGLLMRDGQKRTLGGGRAGRLDEAMRCDVDADGEEGEKRELNQTNPIIKIKKRGRIRTQCHQIHTLSHTHTYTPPICTTSLAVRALPCVAGCVCRLWDGPIEVQDKTRMRQAEPRMEMGSCFA